ncbi:hypothetical protein PCAR4_200055 [Paraburkholderia caribensis]|nr:hypothetical protein PCAR4_200055 [Paraburkholderia caribensis]
MPMPSKATQVGRHANRAAKDVGVRRHGRHIDTATFVYTDSKDVLLFCLDGTLPYPRTATFLIEHRHEIGRFRSAQVQFGGSGARVPDGLRAALLRTAKTRNRNLHRVMDRFFYP